MPRRGDDPYGGGTYGGQGYGYSNSTGQGGFGGSSYDFGGSRGGGAGGAYSGAGGGIGGAGNLYGGSPYGGHIGSAGTYNSVGGGGGYGSYGGVGGGGNGSAFENMAAARGAGGPGGGRGGGGFGGNGGPPQLPYKPEAPAARGMIGSLQEAGAGLLDPNSAYSGRLRNEISEDIGGRGAAMERAAALRAARSGMGAGASPELLETQGDIGRQSLSSIGDATTGAMLGGIGLGGQLLSPALSGEVGLQGQQLSGYMQQQGLQQRSAEAQLQANMQAQQLRNDAMLRELSLMGSFY